jgi:hypothetical protein
MSLAPGLANGALVLACALAAVLILPLRAEAQACCAGTAAVSTGRLTLHEEALVGLEVRALHGTGSFDGDRRYRPADGQELEIEQRIFGSLRLFERAQVGLAVPFVQGLHDTTSQSDFGGGVGDVQAFGRYDFTLAGQSLRIPGVAVLGSVVVPTGRAIEDAESPLGVDATGTGAFRTSGGLALEQSFGRYFANLTGLVGRRAARTVRGSEVPGAWEWIAAAAVGLELDNDLALSLSTSLTHEPAAPKQMFRWGLSAALPVTYAWRVQGGVLGDIPAVGFGLHQSAALGLHLSVMRSWI